MDDWLTAEYCDRHYSLMPLEAIGQLLATLDARSERVRARANVETNVRYGSSPDETFDVFRPAGPGEAVLLFIHGGLWQFGDKSQFSFPAEAWTAAGVTYVAVNYSLVPAVTLEEQLAQCQRAAAFARRHAAVLGAKDAPVYVAGHSSGGHLAAMLLTTDWSTVAPDLPRDVVAGGLTLSGVHDLEAIRRTAFMNAALQLDPARVTALSPARREPNAGVRLYAALGELENEEFQRQTRVLCAAWPQAVQQALVLPGVDHFTILDEFADRGSALFTMAARMVS
jgi:arylformamidase